MSKEHQEVKHAEGNLLQLLARREFWVQTAARIQSAFSLVLRRAPLQMRRVRKALCHQ